MSLLRRGIGRGSVFDFLSVPAPDTLSGVALIVAGLVTAIWGIVSLASGWRKWRMGVIPRPFIPPSYAFWLGVFLLFSDAGIYLILGISVIRDEGGISLWGAVYTAICGLLAFIAFMAWSRERPDG